MRNYTIIKESGHQLLHDVFKLTDFTYRQEENAFHFSDIKDDEQDYTFRTLLSIIIAREAFLKTLNEELDSHNLSKEKRLIIETEADEGFRHNRYLWMTTLAILSDFIGVSGTINLDVFPLFNMEGFQKDIALTVEAMVENGGEIANMDPIEIFPLLIDRMKKEGTYLNEIDTLHIQLDGDEPKIYAYDREGLFVEEISTSFIDELFNGDLILYQENDTSINECFSMASFAINVYPVTKVVFHCAKRLKGSQNLRDFTNFLSVAPSLTPFTTCMCEDEHCQACK